jgi:hypothetical protein
MMDLMSIPERRRPSLLPDDRVSRGLAVLKRDSALLNSKGLELVGKASRLLDSFSQCASVGRENLFQDLSDQVPSLINPHLELFRAPDLAPLIKAKEAGAKSFWMEISKGCENQCLFCYAEASPRMVFMPSTMFLLVVEAAREINGKISFVFHRTDPILYQDSLLGANFADLVSASKDVFTPSLCEGTKLITHGWPKNHEIALFAARKMKTMGIRADRLSVHLFHREFIESASVADLEGYADRYAEAIDLLRPRAINLRGGLHFEDIAIKERHYDKYVNFPPHLTMDFIEDFYRQRIFPRLPADLCQAHPIYDRSKLVYLTRRQTAELPVYPSLVRRPGRGKGDFTRPRLPLCDCEERPNAVFIIYPDGSYSLQEQEKLPRETGMLF